jgi:D-threo-aldose 1-dehydrogenase
MEPMRTRTIGRVSVTELGFGAAQLGNLSRSVTDEDARAAVDEAWSQGIRYFDTAPHYGLGLSERRLGDALADRPRDDFVVSSKVGRLLIDTPERAAAGVLDDAQGFIVPATHRRRWDFSRDGVMRSVEDTLDRLGFDRLDIAYLHDPDAHWEQASTSGVAALMELRDQGVVGAIGAGMNQASMLARFVRECDIDVVMVAGRLTLLDRTAQLELLPLAAERKVAVVAAAVYNSGLLSTRIVSDDASFDYRQASPENIRAAKDLAAICDDAGCELPEAAVQFPLRDRGVASVVVGMRTPDHVRSAFRRYSASVPAVAWRRLVEHSHM